MKLKIYLDVGGWETLPGHFYPFTARRPHPELGKRYYFTVDIPDPMNPDVEVNADIKEQDK